MAKRALKEMYRCCTAILYTESICVLFASTSHSQHPHTSCVWPWEDCRRTRGVTVLSRHIKPLTCLCVKTNIPDMQQRSDAPNSSQALIKLLNNETRWRSTNWWRSKVLRTLTWSRLKSWVISTVGSWFCSWPSLSCAAEHRLYRLVHPWLNF